jgi:NAD(P)-dependent dehydrogenase (short-subunit alcohol dehydrogenase family)
MKRVFITGAARRLGREIALHLAKSGSEIIVHYNRSESDALSLQKEIGCKLFQADFSSVKISQLMKRIDEEVGNVDILINNASSFQKSQWAEVTEEIWDSEQSINLKVPFFLAQHFGKAMKRKGSGKIINMADIAGYRAYLNYLPYSLAKSSVMAMTQALAKALAPEVQVNAIAPGTILFLESLGEESKQKIVQKIPAGRTGRVEELLNTVDFFLSNTDFITGQTIVLDGGRTLTW